MSLATPPHTTPSTILVLRASRRLKRHWRSIGKDPSTVSEGVGLNGVDDTGCATHHGQACPDLLTILYGSSCL